MKRNKDAKRVGFPPIQVRILQDDAAPVERVFTRPFRIGRDRECDIHLPLKHVSRTHAEVNYTNQCWWIHDLESTNGIAINDRKVQHAPINDQDILILGKEGPQIQFRYIQPDGSGFTPGGEGYEDARADADSRLRRKAAIVAASVVSLVLVGIFFGGQQSEEKNRRRAEAETLFHQIKSHDYSIGTIRFAGAADERVLDLLELQSERREMAERYKGYLIEVGLYKDLSPTERLAYNVARFYNESEVTLPAGFMDEVEEAIASYWLEENRLQFERAIRSAEERGYTAYILQALERNGLPLEFYYVPLALSMFDPDALDVDPSGSRRGIWMQDETSASTYGLAIGVYADIEQVDLSDDRHNLYASTEAAVRFLRDLYYGAGEVSALVTMAIYLDPTAAAIILADPLDSSVEAAFFQGEPDDPAHRNYWSLWAQGDRHLEPAVRQRIARIFAAAVIGQDPAAFGFNFANPLAAYQQRSTP